MDTIKFPYIILSFVLTLVLLLVSLFVYHQYFIMKPVDKALSQIEDIIDKEVVINSKDKNITISLDTNDFMARHQEIMAIIQDLRNPDVYTLDIKDHRDQFVIDKYNDLSFEIFEAIETSQYSHLYSIMNSVESPYMLQIEMDEKYIYVNLKKGEHYLYKLIPRNQMIG